MAACNNNIVNEWSFPVFSRLFTFFRTKKKKRHKSFRKTNNYEIYTSHTYLYGFNQQLLQSRQTLAKEETIIVLLLFDGKRLLPFLFLFHISVIYDDEDMCLFFFLAPAMHIMMNV